MIRNKGKKIPSRFQTRKEGSMDM